MPHDRTNSVLVFDVNETLLDITSLEPLFDRLFADASILREWFAELILYSQTLTLSGLYTPFGKLAAGTLHMVGANHGVTVGDNDLAELRTRLGEMPAHTDVVPALKVLQAAGYRLVTLTNSAPSASPTPLEKAGIGDYFEQHFSVEDVQKFKPHPAVYQLVAQRLGVAMCDLCLVACHLWDTVGAQAAGCSGAFLTRPHNSVLPAGDIPEPNYQAATLTALAEQILRDRSAAG